MTRRPETVSTGWWVGPSSPTATESLSLIHICGGSRGTPPEIAAEGNGAGGILSLIHISGAQVLDELGMNVDNVVAAVQKVLSK